VINQIVPVGDETIKRAPARVTKGNSAVHASGSLSLCLFFTEKSRNFLIVMYSVGNGSIHRIDSWIFKKTGCLAHGVWVS